MLGPVLGNVKSLAPLILKTGWAITDEGQ